mgnify:CR=1 FL=1
MSTSIYITTERQYRQLVNGISDLTPFDEVFDRLDEISYYTNFSGNLNRLYGVIDQFGRFEDEFTSEFAYLGYVCSVKMLEHVVASLDSADVYDKWDPIIDRFENEDKILILVDA